MIRSTLAVAAALSLIASILVTPSVTWAKRGGSQSDQTKLVAELAPCCGNPEPHAEGKAARKTHSKDGSAAQDRFAARVEIPIPSTGLGITDPTTADIRLVLSRAGTDYAECFLVLDDNEDESGDDDAGGTSAEFVVKVGSKASSTGPVVKQIKGQCDIDLATADVQPGVPDVQAGDVATVRVVNGSSSVDFLQGTFAAPQHHH